MNTKAQLISKFKCEYNTMESFMEEFLEKLLEHKVICDYVCERTNRGFDVAIKKNDSSSIIYIPIIL
jgi:hypothetical protein